MITFFQALMRAFDFRVMSLRRHVHFLDLKQETHPIASVDRVGRDSFHREVCVSMPFCWTYRCSPSRQQMQANI